MFNSYNICFALSDGTYQSCIQIKLYVIIALESTPTLLAHLSFSNHLSSVCLSVHLSVFLSVNLSSHFLFLRNYLYNFNQSWYKAFLGEGDSSFFSKEAFNDHTLFQAGDNNEIAKILWQNLNIFFPKTTGSMSTKLGIKHPWMKAIKVCSNEGLSPFTNEKSIDEIQRSSSP